MLVHLLQQKFNETCIQKSYISLWQTKLTRILDKFPSLIYVLSHNKLNTLNNKISRIYLTKVMHFLIQ